MTAVRIDIAEKVFPALGGAPARGLYHDFRLEIADKSFVALLGSSGLGKTTLLNMVAGVDRDFKGRVAFSGDRDPRIGYAFQSPRLLPWRTVLQNVVLALPEGEAHVARAKAALAEMGLQDAHDVFPERLSLGMQRRVALARAFALEPELLLMDEPFVSLDEQTAERLRELLADLIRRHPATVLFVTHDSREAVRLADRVVVLAGPPVRIENDVRIDLSAQSRRSASEIEKVRDLLAMAPKSVAATA